MKNTVSFFLEQSLVILHKNFTFDSVEIVLLSKMIGPNILLIDVVFFSVTFKYGKGANDIKKKVKGVPYFYIRAN